MTNTAEFTLTAPTHSVGADHELVIGLMLVNRSAQEQYFNCRFAVVPAIGEVRPKLIAPSGHELGYDLRVRLSRLAGSDFVLLRPGQAVVAGFALRSFYTLKEHGTYQFSARYVSHEIPEELKSSHVFSGEIAANPVSFTL